MEIDPQSAYTCVVETEFMSETYITHAAHALAATGYVAATITVDHRRFCHRAHCHWHSLNFPQSDSLTSNNAKQVFGFSPSTHRTHAHRALKDLNRISITHKEVP